MNPEREPMPSELPEETEEEKMRRVEEEFGDKPEEVIETFDRETQEIEIEREDLKAALGEFREEHQRAWREEKKPDYMGMRAKDIAKSIEQCEQAIRRLTERIKEREPGKEEKRLAEEIKRNQETVEKLQRKYRDRKIPEKKEIKMLSLQQEIVQKSKELEQAKFSRIQEYNERKIEKATRAMTGKTETDEEETENSR